jgi:hypothetical protein
MSILIEKAVQGVAAGIGLVSEGVTAHKARKAARNSETTPAQNIDGSSPPPAYDEIMPDDNNDEREWELDEAQDEVVGGPAPKSEPVRDVTQLADTFLQRHPRPSPSSALSTLPRLPYPIILPQRRPKDRSRGFIRAYAPDLAEFGIDQAMFLDFLETFNSASLASPWINAINLASIGTMFLPSVTGMVVSMAIQITTQIAIEMHGRVRYVQCIHISDKQKNL